MCLGFRLELVDEFTKIVPSVFETFHRLSPGVVCMCKECFKEFFFLSFFFFFCYITKFPKRKVG